MSVAGDFANGIDAVINEMGSALVFTDINGVVQNVRGVITTIGKNDGELINAVGIEGRICYVRNILNAPEKFWTITGPTGAVYTIHDVHEVIVSDTLVAYKLVIKS